MDGTVVIDTDVFVSALLGGVAAGAVLAECLRGRFTPLMGAALLAEYESQLGRTQLFAKGRLDAREREELLEIFLSECRWTRIYYAWRPNLRDEGDNHVVELAVAGGARAIVTRNVRDYRIAAQLRFPDLEIVTPRQLLKGSR